MPVTNSGKKAYLRFVHLQILLDEDAHLSYSRCVAPEPAYSPWLGKGCIRQCYKERDLKIRRRISGWRLVDGRYAVGYTVKGFATSCC